MESMNDAKKRVQAQELIQRLRSKEDLHRYLGCSKFVPANDGIAILCEEKKALKTQNVKLAEISVNNLYDDAMNDPEVSLYLPTKKQLSNKLPERQKLFLCHTCNDQRRLVERNYSRISQEKVLHLFRRQRQTRDQDKRELAIRPVEAPSYFKQDLQLNSLEKSGTGIFLMKEQSKLYRERKSQTKYEVSKRLYSNIQPPESMNIDVGASSKRRNLGGGKQEVEEKKEKPAPSKEFKM